MSSDGSVPTTGGSRLIFVGGLHRSGTTPLARILGQHPDISSFSDTGVPEDEGQHLQSVYPAAQTYGGSGHFARKPEAHLTESAALATPHAAEQLLQAWYPHWDLSRRYLLEKSPPNLIMTRYLQALYPDAAFIIVVRHPVTVALSTKKWTRFLSRDPRKFASLAALVEHWLIAHRLLASDLPHIRRVRVLFYEDLVSEPERELDGLRSFLGLEASIPRDLVSGQHGSPYAQRWDEMQSLRRPGGWQRRWIERRYAEEIASFGYDVSDLSRHSSHVSQLPQLGP
jgi:Sulfotransferase family